MSQGAGRSTRESLAQLGDPDLAGTLAHLGTAAPGPEADPDRTASYAVGTATSDGQRFRVVRPHARGGLGAVFVALDTELHREVALKQILDQHADDPVSRQRFLLEAEVTGGLEHPGIVPVYGLGTYGDGRPYYAMRFIKGNSLKEAIQGFHADETLRRDPGRRSLELRKLLRRFTDVCNAIAYAHSRGVLHRDLKPGNVIVGQHGETLVVDWGLAKATGQSEPGSGERTLRPSSASGSAETLPGSALGTPAYMSPEQAEGNLEALGPRSDVYSLGATLYCLLTGRPPFAGETGDVLRAVQRGEIRPPRLIDPSLDRALQAVCLQAMALRPEDRYNSPRALAEDVERWMADEPVSAWRESLARRVRRWGRRNRTAVAAILVALVSGVAGLGAVAGVQARANAALGAKNLQLTAAQATTERALTQTQEEKRKTEAALAQSEASRQRAEAVLGFLKDDVLASARPEGQEGGLGVDVTVRKAVEAAEPKIARAFQDQPVVEADVRDTLGTTYWYLGEAPHSIRQHERALELRRTKLGPDHPDTLSSRNNLAVAYKAAGRTADAITLLEATIKQRESKLGPDHPDTLSSRHNLAAAYRAAGRTAEAVTLFEATLKQKESKLGPDHPSTLVGRTNLALAYQAAGRTADAITLHQATLKHQESKLGADHPDTLTSRNNLATAYYAAGRAAEAIAVFEATLKQDESRLGPDHPHTLTSRSNLALAYLEAGRAAEAIRLNEATLKQRESKLGPDHPDTLMSRNNLALAYKNVGRTAEAITLHEATLKQCESKLGLDHPGTLTSRTNLAGAYLAAGRAADAITLYQATLKLSESKLGPDHPSTLVSRNNLALAYQEAGRTEEAMRLHEATLKQRESKLGPDHPDTLTSRNNLANAYHATGRAAEAIRLYEATLKHQESKLGPDHPNTLKSRSNLANAYQAAGRTSEAIRLHEATLKQRESKLGPDHPDTLISRNNLAWAYLAARRLTDALSLFEDTLKRLQTKLGPDHPDTLLIMNNLAGAYLEARRWAEAERTARACLSLRVKKQPDDWRCDHTKSQLGAALAGQRKYAEAEPLILAGYEGMKARAATIPAPSKSRLTGAAERVVQLYEGWEKPDQAAQWKARLGLPDLPADVFAQP
jgi:tetratricopeptide (TPR) repeat protein/tRNA A-37 threonylcarbamoyl transferase component Bud32